MSDAVDVLSLIVRVSTVSTSLGGGTAQIDYAFARLHALLHDEPEPPRAKPKPQEAEEDDEVSSWDPPTHEEVMDASHCRALMLEVIRRAVHDLVLYRFDRRQRDKAEHAYTWLFEEKPGHPWWEMRKRSGMRLTAFLTICEILELDPETVRLRARRLTPKQITTAGRPAERRSRQVEEPHYDEHGVSDAVSLSSLEAGEDTRFSSMYEAHYAVHTPD